MSENKKVISLCPNFYKIINFNPLIGDIITTKIIDLYHDYIFNIDTNNNDDINSVKELDTAVSKYIDDYHFRKAVQRQIITIKFKEDTKDIVRAFVNEILRIFDNYDEYTTRIIYISRWV